ncbi:MAG TPA: alpha/beta hydrolase [Pararhizobium sp.]|uniref:alpha/beta fold hydrolase n=1 Tax=Pararhizobium sp. TaxID=1977563 RepID=UPI002B56A2E3|nr:alpha/beta hydrolase [Pararhizobium sp.]HTO32249.1 alpha/beta hydrolase [Pararhizobium sp.]
MATSDDGFEERFFTASDGLRLYARDYGHADDRKDLPIVCLPGLSRNSRDFHRLALQLSTQAERPRRVVTFDYRGRGRSEWDADTGRYALSVEADDVLTGCAALDVQQAIFIGTSRGGLITHLLAAMRPAILRGVILNDIGPVIEIAGLLQIRLYLEARPVLHSWEDAVDNLQRVHGPAFPALDPSDWTDMAHAIFTEKDGMIVADFDPSLIEPLRSLDENAQIPDIWSLYEGLKPIPLMTIRGENSPILSEATFIEMKARHPGMKTVTAAGQGHAPLLHGPKLVGEIRDFINAIAHSAARQT